MHHEGEEADGLLSAWTTLWHPALLASYRPRPQLAARRQSTR